VAHSLDQITRAQPQRFKMDEILDRVRAESPDDLQPVLRALRDRDRVPHRQLARWLSDHGWFVSASAILVYRDRGLLDGWCESRDVKVKDA
jgi:hypothetical protein